MSDAMSKEQGSRFSEVNQEILRTLSAPRGSYWALVSILFFFVLFAGCVWVYQLRYGLGVAGYHPSGMWGVYLVNFVFWIGIAHSGTLISAILYLRAAEETHGDESPEMPQARDALRLGVSLLAIIRSITDWGRR